MHRVRPLPGYLIQRYHGWKATKYKDNQAWFRELAEGQSPRAMVIACCDSRVLPSVLFDAGEGEIFMHRIIASLVPPYEEKNAAQATPAAIEYAVTALKVAHVVVLGHSNCGGVRGCDAMCSGKAKELESQSSFVGRWLDLLRPGYDRVKDIEDETTRITELEKQAVIVSLENLMSFPFVRDAIAAGTLSVHGLWHNIGEGVIEHYSALDEKFVPV